jgi:hypothetical protein
MKDGIGDGEGFSHGVQEGAQLSDGAAVKGKIDDGFDWGKVLVPEGNNS